MSAWALTLLGATGAIWTAILSAVLYAARAPHDFRIDGEQTAHATITPPRTG